MKADEICGECVHAKKKTDMACVGCEVQFGAKPTNYKTKNPEYVRLESYLSARHQSLMNMKKGMTNSDKGYWLFQGKIKMLEEIMQYVDELEMN